jgi:ABC-type transport system substrate-binding protein
MDPDVAYATTDEMILQNVYEPLVWYNGNSSTQVIPWLASNYTTSADALSVKFTLRNGITFADGEQLNSTAVYFSLNRLLVLDASTPYAHGTQAGWIIQQLLDTRLFWELTGPHKYNEAWKDQVLAQNLVETTGPMTLTLHFKTPMSGWPYLFANNWAVMMAPGWVMTNDLQLWNGQGYKLPYPTLSGNEISMVNQYFSDLVATCDAGPTPNGCGATSLNTSTNGSQASSGPYTLASVDWTANKIVLQANPNYWGGPYQYMGGAKIFAHIPTIYINYVPQLSTREIDLQIAGKSGQAMAIDVGGDHVFDVADKTSWIANHQLVPIISGTALYGPYPIFATKFLTFEVNVTSDLTGQLLKFQPFADTRFRLAFADAVNITEIESSVDNNMGVVANNFMPPGFPPTGSYDPSVTPRYHYDLDETQNLLLDAMMHPLSNFNFYNGTQAPPGVFDNHFGCSALVNAKCQNPTPQTLALTYIAGDTVSEAIATTIATNVNNVSLTYNMGLSVVVRPLPHGQAITEQVSGHLYMFVVTVTADYPWSNDLLSTLFVPNAGMDPQDGWSISEMGNLYSIALHGTATNNATEVVEATKAMNSYANNIVMYLWVDYPTAFTVMTSNVRGYYFNPSLWSGYQSGLVYFATLY